MLVANSSTTEGYNSNWIILSIILFTTFIPSHGKLTILKLIIIFALWLNRLSYKLQDPRIISYRKKCQNIIFLWFVSIFLAAIAVVIVETSLNYSVIIHELSRIAYYLFLILLCFNISISLKILFYACSIIILIHCGIQYSQYRSLGIVDDFITQYYLSGDEENAHYLMARVIEGNSFRSGSIFLNPNVYVCYPYLSLAVFLQYYRTTKGFLPLIMIGVAFISIILTGSRMGMGAFIFILGWYLWYSSKNRTSKNNNSHKGFLIIMGLVIFALLYYENLSNSIQETRAFTFENAYEGSGATKWDGLLGYLKISYPLEWLFGSLGANRLAIPIDMEFGYIFAWFGIIGLIWYIKLIKLIYDYHRRDFPIISTIAAFSISLTAIGASSVLNMSVFPYICLISFTNIFVNKKQIY